MNMNLFSLQYSRSENTAYLSFWPACPHFSTNKSRSFGEQCCHWLTKTIILLKTYLKIILIQNRSGNVFFPLLYTNDHLNFPKVYWLVDQILWAWNEIYALKRSVRIFFSQVNVSGWLFQIKLSLLQTDRLSLINYSLHNALFIFFALHITCHLERIQRENKNNVFCNANHSKTPDREISKVLRISPTSYETFKTFCSHASCCHGQQNNWKSTKVHFVSIPSITTIRLCGI